ncbi:MAG: Tim44/TimA family putative adaptor protein [Alphaproteobacteria bacterium]|nr:Tim44/TimA family putative adaptor protein [Alphaproteobacteria bacterium]
MSDFLDIPTLIAIGVIIVVFLRMRSILGTRTGSERPPVPRARPSNADRATDAGDDMVVAPRPQAQDDADSLGDERRRRKLEAEIEQLAATKPEVAAGLTAIAAADPAFMPKSFLEGAKAAYEMIVTAFAGGDRKTLKTLLDKEVYDGFEQVISERESAGQAVDFTFVGLPGIEFSEVEFDKKTASITLNYRAEIVSATRDASGALIEGNADQVVTIKDEWTFARNVKSRDPNWKLVATHQLD